MWCEHTWILPTVHPSINGVQNSISSPWCRKIEKSSTQKPFASSTECKTDRVIHPACDHSFQLTPIRKCTIDMGCTRGSRPAVGELMLLWSKGTFTPVEKTIGSTIRAVHIVSTIFNRTAIKPYRPFVRDMITSGITQFPNMRWRTDIH